MNGSWPNMGCCSHHTEPEARRFHGPGAGFLAGAGHELEQHGVHLSVYYPGSAPLNDANIDGPEHRRERERERDR